MKHTGTVTLHIDGKETVYFYKNRASRQLIIDGFLPRRMEGKTCYYTITPKAPPPFKPLRRPNLTGFVRLTDQRKIVAEYKRGSRTYGMPALMKKYKVAKNDMRRIIYFNSSSPTKHCA